jgi:hypothetical protein
MEKRRERENMVDYYPRKDGDCRRWVARSGTALGLIPFHISFGLTIQSGRTA